MHHRSGLYTHAPITQDAFYQWGRIYLPYALESVDEGTKLIILNRNYKPIGFANKSEWVDYAAYPEWHVSIDDLNFAATVSFFTGRIPEVVDNYQKRIEVNQNAGRSKFFHFWSDSCQPPNHLAISKLHLLYDTYVQRMVGGVNFKRICELIRIAQNPEGLFCMRESHKCETCGVWLHKPCSEVKGGSCVSCREGDD